MVQRGSNLFGQYLSVLELEVGGRRRSIIIPAGKVQQRWRAFGRRMLDPSQYVLGGPKFVLYKSKQPLEIYSSWSFVETVKAPVQASLKHSQQPFIREKGKNRIVKKTKVESPRDKPCTQVVVFEAQAGKSSLTAVGGVAGRVCDINGDNKFEAKVQEGNKQRFPLRFNLNSKNVAVGKERDIRRSRWLGKGLIVEVNENGKRWVSWDHYKSLLCIKIFLKLITRLSFIKIFFAPCTIKIVSH